MDSKSALTLLFLLTHASSILQIRGNQMPQKVDNKNKQEGAFMPELRLGISPQNSSISIGDSTRMYSHYASYSLTGKLVGVRAIMTLWKIADVQPLSSSLTFIGSHNFDNDHDKIIAGVHVYPHLYNNNDLRFFTYWSSGDKGCYNLVCPGFVVADGANLHPGQALAPLSVYGCRLLSHLYQKTNFMKKLMNASCMRKDFERYRYQNKDQKTGDWSLYREDKGGPIGGMMTLLGWWPKTLFAGLSEHATLVEWTGSVFHPEGEISPSMGSGHFSDEIYEKAASFKQLGAFDKLEGPFRPAPYDLKPFMDRKQCYNVSSVYDLGSHGTHFFYGGPGGCFDFK